MNSPLHSPIYKHHPNPINVHPHHQSSRNSTKSQQRSPAPTKLNQHQPTATIPSQIPKPCASHKQSTPAVMSSEHPTPATAAPPSRTRSNPSSPPKRRNPALASQRANAGAGSAQTARARSAMTPARQVSLGMSGSFEHPRRSPAVPTTTTREAQSNPSWPPRAETKIPAPAKARYWSRRTATPGGVTQKHIVMRPRSRSYTPIPKPSVANPGPVAEAVHENLDRSERRLRRVGKTHSLRDDSGTTIAYPGTKSDCIYVMDDESEYIKERRKNERQNQRQHERERALEHVRQLEELHERAIEHPPPRTQPVRVRFASTVEPIPEPQSTASLSVSDRRPPSSRYSAAGSAQREAPRKPRSFSFSHIFEMMCCVNGSQESVTSVSWACVTAKRIERDELSRE